MTTFNAEQSYLMIQDLPPLLPAWAVGTTNDYMTLGAQLCTRDGRKIGNAVVIGFDDPMPQLCSEDAPVAIVLTDMGNKTHLTEREMRDLFYRPKYIMDLNDRYRKGYNESVHSDE